MKQLTGNIQRADNENWRQTMTMNNLSEAAKAVVRRNTDEVQSAGNFDLFEQLFAEDFRDHTPQPGRTPDKDGARQLYKILRAHSPTFVPRSIGNLPMATA
jgi:hypothetical protein